MSKWQLELEYAERRILRSGREEGMRRPECSKAVYPNLERALEAIQEYHAESEVRRVVLKPV